MTTSHANCDHEATSSARALCRKARADRQVLVEGIASYFEDHVNDRFYDWLLRGAWRFGSYQGNDHLEAASALLEYFFPANEATHDRRRRDGYTVTTSPSVMRSVILNSFS